MRFRFHWVSLFIAFTIGTSFAQTQTIIFRPVFGNADLRLNSSYYKLNEKDSVLFETFRFYISKIELLDKDKIVWKEKNSFHLIDASEGKTLQFTLQIPKEITFTQLKCNLGIDSATNVSGALGGDLDPTKGMYWAWQSGYINFKLEGKSNLCKTRNNQFQFHLGGYLSPFNALRSFTLEMSRSEKTIIRLDISKFLSGIDLSKQNEIMSPTKEAVLLSEKAAQSFSVQK